REALAKGAIELQSTPGNQTVVFGVVGDMMLIPVIDAARALAEQGIGSKIVAVVNPRRLYRPSDVAWQSCSQPDGEFLSDAEFAALFEGDALIGVTGGASAMVEPLMLRSPLPRDVLAWKRGETAASASQLFALNGLTAEKLAERAKRLLAI
ncbi:MAG: phosphoketolase, partial [Cyanobacteria bacterium P01_G01_bin.38]